MDIRTDHFVTHLIQVNQHPANLTIPEPSELIAQTRSCRNTLHIACDRPHDLRGRRRINLLEKLMDSLQAGVSRPHPMERHDSNSRSVRVLDFFTRPRPPTRHLPRLDRKTIPRPPASVPRRRPRAGRHRPRPIPWPATGVAEQIDPSANPASRSVPSAGVPSRLTSSWFQSLETSSIRILFPSRTRQYLPTRELAAVTAPERYNPA